MTAEAFAAALRAAAASALPPGAFLRRDRGEALYVTDAPRFLPGDDGWLRRLEQAGFRCRVRGALCRLTPDDRWFARLTEAFPEPPDDLSRSVRDFSDPAADDSLYALFAAGVKLLDAGARAEPAAALAYRRALRQTVAVCLRNHTKPAGLYACAVIAHLTGKETNP